MKFDEDGRALAEFIVRRRTYHSLAEGKRQMRDRCESIAQRAVRETEQELGQPIVLKLTRKNLSGRASAVWIDGKEHGFEISATPPRTRSSLFIFLHEVAHIRLGHLSRSNKRKGPAHRQEYEAEVWARDRMRAEGVAVPKKQLDRAKRYVFHKIEQAIKAGARTIDRDAAKFAGWKGTMMKPRPHGISCRCCYEQLRCNQCGAKNVTAQNGRCTNGRCRRCCPKVCQHVTE